MHGPQPPPLPARAATLASPGARSFLRRSPRRRRPSAFARWLRSFAQWTVALLLVLVGSSYAAWGLGHFLWVARGREGDWRTSQRKAMMDSFLSRGRPVLGAAPGDRERAIESAISENRIDLAERLRALPAGLMFAGLGVGLEEHEFVAHATSMGGQWFVNEPEPVGWLLNTLEASQGFRLSPAGESVHPWAFAGPGAVYRKDAGGRVTHCTLQFEAPWDSRTSMPLERLSSAWRLPSALAWSANGRGRIVATWLLEDMLGNETQMALMEWECQPASFGKRQKAIFHLHLFDARDPLWSSRRPTGGLMPTDPLADSVRGQLEDPDYSATKRLYIMDSDAGAMGPQQFEELFGFPRSTILGIGAPPRPHPAVVRRIPSPSPLRITIDPPSSRPAPGPSR